MLRKLQPDTLYNVFTDCLILTLMLLSLFVKDFIYFAESKSSSNGSRL